MRDKDNDGVKSIGWRSSSFSRTAESVAFGKIIYIQIDQHALIFIFKTT